MSQTQIELLDELAEFTEEAREALRFLEEGSLSPVTRTAAVRRVEGVLKCQEAIVADYRKVVEAAMRDSSEPPGESTSHKI